MIKGCFKRFRQTLYSLGRGVPARLEQEDIGLGCQYGRESDTGGTCVPKTGGTSSIFG